MKKYIYHTEKINPTTELRAPLSVTRELVPELTQDNPLDTGIASRQELDVLKAQYKEYRLILADLPLREVEEEWYLLTLKYDAVYEEIVQYNVGDTVIEYDSVIKMTDSGLEKLKKMFGNIEYKLNAMETNHEWLIELRGGYTEVKRPVVTEPLVTPKLDRDKLIAYERDLTVRDLEGSVADIAKMVSLSFSAISALWSITSDEAKDELPSEVKKTIEYATSKFNAIQTRADRQLKVENTKFIDKLYEREVAIADIVDNN